MDWKIGFRPLFWAFSPTHHGGSVYNAIFNTSDDFALQLYSYDLGPQYYTYMGANFIWDNDPPASVPEPGTLALLGMGSLGLFALARRQVFKRGSASA